MKWLAAGALGAGVLLAAEQAHAQCQGRPTDSNGYAGYAYGAAPVSSYATADVRVHYATGGTHAVALASQRPDSVPDTVALTADLAQDAITKFAERGFRKPPADTCPSNGGDPKLDLYLVRFAGADGSTPTESCTTTCQSFLLVDSTFSGRGYPTIAEGFRTVVTHEVFHAIQNAYSKNMDRAWAEGTAQWAMKSLHPELTDFEKQLPPFFREPKRALDTPPSGAVSGFLYGSAVWPLFLSIQHGDELIRSVFEEEATGTKSIEAMAVALESAGSSLKVAAPLFRAWNIATGDLASPSGYPDASKYPGVPVEELVDGAAGITSSLGSFGYRGTINNEIFLETDETRNAGILVPIVDGIPDLASTKPLPASHNGEAIVIVSGITTKKTDAPFTIRYRAYVNTPPPGGSDAESGCSAAPSHRSGLETLGIVALAALFSRAWRRKRAR